MECGNIGELLHSFWRREKKQKDVEHSPDYNPKICHHNFFFSYITDNTCQLLEIQINNEDLNKIKIESLTPNLNFGLNIRKLSENSEHFSGHSCRPLFLMLSNLQIFSWENKNLFTGNKINRYKCYGLFRRWICNQTLLLGFSVHICSFWFVVHNCIHWTSSYLVTPVNIGFRLSQWRKIGKRVNQHRNWHAIGCQSQINILYCT